MANAAPSILPELPAAAQRRDLAQRGQNMGTNFRNLILTGFMGTGKSTVGRLLAGGLGWRFVDTDTWIEEQTGQSVATIFATQGESVFRAWESLAALTFGAGSNQVIATGGRLMLDPANALDLGEGALTLCLAASPETLLARLTEGGVERPLLAGEDPEGAIRTLLAQRADGYAQFSAVATDGRSAEDVAAQILTGLAEGRWQPYRPTMGHRLDVCYPGGAYPVHVGVGLLPAVGSWLPANAALISDSHVAPLWAEQCPTMPVITVPAGEQHKGLDTVARLYDELLAAGLDRTSTIVALGGGVVGDMAGFVAATYMRGIAYLQCPTTLLAMVDASVGGKTGVDLPEGKNLVGAFHQPRAVLASVETLSTLPAVEFRAGMSEVVKHGLIASPALLRQAATVAQPESRETGDQVDLRSQRSLILRAIQVKRDVVETDPFETGARARLNLGHTFAHAVEQVTGYRVRHGEAVAMGLVAAADLSVRLGHAVPPLVDELRALLETIGLPTRFPPGLGSAALIEAMGRDKKTAAGVLRFVLIRDVGYVFISDDVPRAALAETLIVLGAAD
jgi:3-dehydroquinate synthase